MIVELVKFVAESEGKISRAVLNCTKYLFALVLSIKLYTWFMGPWRTGETSEWEMWREWIVTGKVFVSLFLFCVSYFLLFQVLSAFIVAFLVWFERRPGRISRLPKESGPAIVKLLAFFGFLTCDKSGGQVSGTRHTAKLIEYLQSVNTSEHVEGMEGDFSGFQDIWVLYIFFVCYFLFTGLWRHAVITVVVAVLLAGIPLLYRFIRQFYRMLVEHASELLFVMEGIDLCREIELALQRQGCPVSVKEGRGGIGGRKIFGYRGKEYVFVYYRVDGIFTTVLFQGFVKANLGEAAFCVLFTNSVLEDGIGDMVREYGERLTVVVFQEAVQLPEMLQRRFPRAFPKNVVF